MMPHLPFIYKLEIGTRLSGTNKTKHRKVIRIKLCFMMLKFSSYDNKNNFIYKPLWSNHMELNFACQWATFGGKYDRLSYVTIVEKKKIANIKINNQTFLQDTKNMTNEPYISTWLTEDELFRILKSLPIITQTIIGNNESNLLLTKPYRLRYKSHLNAIRQYVDEEKNKYLK